MPESNCKPLPPITESDIERFWKYVDKRGPDECWPWIGARSSRGYGVFEMRTATVRACRVAYFVQNGEDPYPHLIRHSCDYSACSNGAHLIAGTHLENMRDARERGLTTTGDKNGSRIHPEALMRGSGHSLSKLTEEMVSVMLTARAGGASLNTLADKYGIHISEVSKICIGKFWAHVEGPRTRVKKPTLMDDVILGIRAGAKKGRRQADLATEYGVSISGVSAIIRGRIRPDLPV